ncbi:hypothetical protein EMCRGX_G034924 [Ephydatia muelleri]
MGFLSLLKRSKVAFILLVFTFIVSGLIVNCMQLLTVPLYFTNKRLFRVVNAKLVYLHWCILPWSLQSWANYDIRVFGSQEDLDRYANKEHALCLLNHHGDLDWMIGWCLVERLGMLGGVKAIMKDIAKFLPGIGWTFVFMEYPFLTRSWENDEKRLEAACKNLLDYPVNMPLCLFAEGTRFTQEKYLKSVEFSKSRGLPVLKHHLFPRTKGFCLLMKYMKGSIPAIYDITIRCPDVSEQPTLMDVINAKPCRADIYFRRFSLSDLPESEEALTKWLIDLYRDKDDVIEYHIKNRKFPGDQIKLSKRPWMDVVVFMWILLLAIPVSVAMVYLAYTGAWLTLGLIVLILFVTDQLFMCLARETDSKLGSSHGLEPVTVKEKKTN